jgi:hypothetical protein
MVNFLQFYLEKLIVFGQQFQDIEHKNKRAFLPKQFIGLGGFNNKKFTHILI